MSREKGPIKPKDFREKLTKIMPGYQWTIHKEYPPADGCFLAATGTQSSGFNRLSTLSVTRRARGDSVEYEVKSSGVGVKAPWLHETTGTTLARALRSLQEFYEHQAALYGGHASSLQGGRKHPPSAGD